MWQFGNLKTMETNFHVNQNIEKIVPSATTYAFLSNFEKKKTQSNQLLDSPKIHKNFWKPIFILIKAFLRKNQYKKRNYRLYPKSLKTKLYDIQTKVVVPPF